MNRRAMILALLIAPARVGSVAGQQAEPADPVVLTPSEYQKLRDKISKLRAENAKLRAEPAAPAIPSRCQVVGKVSKVGGRPVGKMTLTYSLKTDADGQWAALGCRGAKPSRVRVDGGDADLAWRGGELLVRLGGAGTHTATVEVELPARPRPTTAGEVGFDLGLPGCPITLLKLDGPDKVKRIRLGLRRAEGGEGGEATYRFVDAAELRKADRALGPVDRLSVSWEPPAPAARPAAGRRARGDIVVTVEDGRVRTEARLEFAGPGKEWKLAAPAGAEVRVEPAGDPTDPADPEALAGLADLPTVTPPGPRAKNPVWVIGPAGGTGPFRVVVTVTQARNPRGPRAGGPFSVGPFAAAGVFPQPGTVRVTAPPHLRLAFRPHGSLRRARAVGPTPPTDADDAVTEFRYLTVPRGDQDRPEPLMTFRVRELPGRAVSTATHTLRLTARGWAADSQFTVTPVRTAVESLELAVPPSLTDEKAWSPDAPGLIEGVGRVGPARGRFRTLRVRLASPTRSRFTVRLAALVPHAGPTRRAAFNLPRALGTDGRDGRVRVEVPEGYRLTGGVREWAGRRPGEWSHALRPAGGVYVAKMGRRAGRVNLTWATPAEGFRYETTADVTVGVGRLTVVQEFRFPTRPGGPPELTLRGPEGVSGLRALTGAVLRRAGLDGWVVAPGGGGVVRVEYGAAAGPGGQVRVPLLGAAGAAWAESRVRVWRGRGALSPVSAGGPWQEHPPRAVAGRAELPALHLTAGGLRPGLTLRLRRAEPAQTPGLLIDRALVQVAAAGDGRALYRARLRLRRWGEGGVTLRLPEAARPGETDVLLDGSRVTGWSRGTEAGRPTVSAAVPAGDGVRVLEVRYAVNVGVGSPAGRLLAVEPPEVVGGASVGSARWQVVTPERSMAVCLGGPIFRPGYAWSGGLFWQRGTPSADLEAWFRDGESAGGAGTAWGGPGTRALTGRGDLRPFRVLLVPRGLWVAGCSALFLAGGLLVIRLPGGLVWPAAMAVGAAVAAAAMFAPQAAGQVLVGAQPGAAVFCAVWLTRSALRYRHRYRLTHLPAFSRQGAGSSILHEGNGSASRDRRAPSTQDQPAEA